MFQIWIWQRDTPNTEAWKCFVFRSKIPLCKFQDLLQHSCGWEGRLDYLCFECGWLKHPRGPAGWADILCVTAHQHHVPQIQGRQCLHSPRDPLRHRHQRYEGHIRLRSAQRKTDRCELWFQSVSICSCHVIIQHEGSALILMGRRSFDALSCAVFAGSIKSPIGCCLSSLHSSCLLGLPPVQGLVCKGHPGTRRLAHTTGTCAISEPPLNRVA